MNFFKKLIIIVLSKFHPLIRMINLKYNILGKIEKKLYLFVLLLRKDFASEMEYNVQTARNLGVKIGENCRIFGGVKFSTEPYLIEIGDNVLISGNVSFITHDGSALILRDDEPNIMGYYGKIKIGNNCIIGNSAMIMPNIEIGENSIIAARSFVIDSFPPNSVIMGNPAKFVFRTELYKKMKHYSKNTIKHSKFSYPHEEEIPYELKKKIILEQLNTFPIRKPRKTR